MVRMLYSPKPNKIIPKMTRMQREQKQSEALADLLREEGVVEDIVAVSDDVLEAGVDPLAAVGQLVEPAHSSLDRLQEGTQQF